MFDKDCIICLLVFCCLSGVCLGLQVRQSPSDLITKPGDTVQIFCSHDKTDYRVMLWYQRPPGDTAMKLIGHLYSKAVTMEDPYKESFNISGDLSGTTAKNGSLIIKAVGQEDSAVYYCAAREGQPYAEAHFGAGTKLTVLEPGINVTAPTVRVLKPCKSQKGNKTLVCVASGFYPDHVSVSWEIDDVVVNKKRVATDNAAVREDKYYNITSLLRVSEEEWYTEGKKFHCAVRFYDGSDYIYRNKTVLGKQKVLMNTEQYLATTRIATISYSVVIAKSCIYGAFVAVLVWKLQGSAGKQDD